MTKSDSEINRCLAGFMGWTDLKESKLDAARRLGWLNGIDPEGERGYVANLTKDLNALLGAGGVCQKIYERLHWRLTYYDKDQGKPLARFVNTTDFEEVKSVWQRGEKAAETIAKACVKVIQWAEKADR